MTEDKADKALRKVIINLIPAEYSGQLVPNGVMVSIDISDKLEDDKHYCLDSIEVDYDTRGGSIGVVTYEELQRFKKAVENILDATIVNAKQRDSIQKLLNDAYYNAPGSSKAMVY